MSRRISRGAKPQEARRRLIRRMVRGLDRRYGGAAWLDSRGLTDPLESMVRTILSQNTTDENRDRGYDSLRKRFRTWQAVADADPEDVKEAVRPAGLPNQKGPAIQALLHWLAEYNGELSLDFLRDLEVEQAIALLLQLKGVGVKTIYVVLAFSCGKDVCAVDTHVHRIATRTGIIDAKCTRERAHTELSHLIPKGKARGFHLDLIDFGRNVCTARSPSCGECSFRNDCEYHRSVEAG